MLGDPAVLEVEVAGSLHRAPVTGSGEVRVGPLRVRVEDRCAGSGGLIRWSVGADGPAVPVRRVGLVFPVTGGPAPLRMFRHGYQSWSPTGVATFGVDEDPSRRADFEFLQAVHHADQRTARAGELRSEAVTVLAGAPGSTVLVGFAGGDRHDGTLRLRPAEALRNTAAELVAEAFLGDARLDPGEPRVLADVLLDGDGAPDPVGRLERWADEVGRRGGARTGAAPVVGWCSWYQYFGDVTEAVLAENLARAADWPFRLFQLDDGYQAGIGDWLRTNDRFPGGVEGIASRIAAAGLVPGLWLAPFLVAPDSPLCTRHPDWVARHPSGDPLIAWWNPAWGGGRDGFMYALDTTHPEVTAHLRDLAAALVAMGYRYLKLDFTFAPGVDGIWADPTMTPAQRVRAGFDAIRDGAGADTFLLGCGVPLGAVVGVVDGCRIGQDVAPRWSLRSDEEVVAGYLDTQPATRHAYVNTLTRAFLHRRLWSNDPDCVMLRTTGTELDAAQVRTWAQTVGVSGGMVLASDDLALLGPDARALLDEVLELSAIADAAARAGHGARVPDLLEHREPRRLTVDGLELETDPATGVSRLSRSR